MTSVLFLTGEYPPRPGGVGDYTRLLAAALAARGHAAGVLTIEGDALVCYRCGARPDEERRRELLRKRGLDWSPRCWPAVISALTALRPAWLHIQYQTGAYAMRPGVNLLPWRLRGLPGRPSLAVTFHDVLEPYLFPKAGPLRGWVNARLARDTDLVIATNSADARALAAFRSRPSTAGPVVIPIGSNIPVAPPPGYQRDAGRERTGAAPGELLVAYFGLLAASKGVDTLIEALALLKRPWRLLLIGGAATAPQDIAYTATVRGLITARGLGARVVETGHLAPAEVSASLLAADIVALPFEDGASFRRGSLLAALAHGCPLITTTPAEPNDATLLAPAARLVPPGQPRALADALAALAAAPEARAALAAAGPRLAAQFSWQAIAQRHEELYRIEPTHESRSSRAEP